MDGFVHSIETFGTVDGPGVRFVVFLKGCPMRCLYCHNPDTWDIEGATKKSADELLAMYQRNRMFYSNGGITITGGEPLVQIDFLIELFSKAKSLNIHTCVDTSGVLFNKIPQTKMDQLISVTDLFLLDIKQIYNEEHIKLTGHPNTSILEFAKYLDKNNKPMWIRHVVVPGITDNDKELYDLGKFLSTLNNIEALDVLPYHDMGKVKYQKLNIPYPLENVKPLSKEETTRARNIIIKAIQENKK